MLELQTDRSGGRRRRIFKIGAAVVAAILVIGASGSYLYWQSLKSSPQYSLALLVDAAKRGDQPMIDSLVSVDQVVDDFLPQIMSKAVEIYGRGLPPADTKGFAAYQAACRAALSHIHLLVKLAHWARAAGGAAVPDADQLDRLVREAEEALADDPADTDD